MANPVEREEPVKYSMRAVALETGLSADVIRVWEKRYNAVSPGRTATGRRFYSALEVERLKLLRSATLQGHAIGRVANLTLEQLRALVGHAPFAETAGAEAASLEAANAEHAVPQSFFAASHLEQCVAAMERLDAELLENALARAVVYFGAVDMMEAVLEPLLERMGHLWESGGLRIAEEHVASAVLRTFLGSLMRHAVPAPLAPLLAVTTPANQIHELGALMVAATAAQEGWKVLYLGANLPAEEMAVAARRSGALAVALSIVYPPDDPNLRRELHELRRRLPATMFLAGGRAAADYDVTLRQIQAKRLRDLRELRRELAVLWPSQVQRTKAELAKAKTLKAKPSKAKLMPGRGE